MVHMEYYLVVSTFMMFAGIYGFFTRRNLLAMLISVELILNSVDINFAVFNRYLFPNELEGVFFALFAIGVSAAETAVAIAIIINIYRNIRNIQVKNLNEMKNLIMEYTILILILPFLSFLILGLAGMRMKNSVAGAIGTASLTGVALLSYLTAFHYFTGGRTAAGTFPHPHALQL